MDLGAVIKQGPLAKKQRIVFANYTFPESVRTLEVPSFVADERFMQLVVGLHNDAHEATKERLRQSRSGSRHTGPES